MDVPSEIVIGVDPHKASWTAAAVDRQQQTLNTIRVQASLAGYAQLQRFAAAWPQARWAVEGAGGLGTPLTRLLTADGVRVLDVPAKLSARVRALGHGHGRKNDPADATCVAIAAHTSRQVRRVMLSENAETLRLLSQRREELITARTQTINRIHALLLQLTPGGVPGNLTAVKASTLLDRVHPRELSARTRHRLASELVDDLRRLDRQLKALERDIHEAVAASGTGLTQLHGIGSVLAARIIGRVGDVSRFPDAGHFASYVGTAPIEVSSGDVTRHRLSRAGDRGLNHALHMMALTQIRGQPDGRAYYLRKRAAGKSHQEALRCLKRHLADVVYRQLVRDAHDNKAKSTTGPGGHVGATPWSCAADPTPPVSSSDQSLPRPANRQPTTPSRQPA